MEGAGKGGGVLVPDISCCQCYEKKIILHCWGLPSSSRVNCQGKHPLPWASTLMKFLITFVSYKMWDREFNVIVSDQLLYNSW